MTRNITNSNVILTSKKLLENAKDTRDYISDKLNSQRIKEIEEETLKGVGLK